MADPLSGTASVVGVLGFALHGAKRLYEFIDSLRSAPKDIATLSADLRALYEVLAVLAGMQDTLLANSSLCQCLQAPLDNCVDVFEDFTVTLHKYTTATRDGGTRVRTWKNLEWAFKDKEIQLFRDTLITYKASLDLAVGALTLSSAINIDERTRRMEIDFKEDMKHIRSKLQDLDTDRVELVSTAGRRGSEWHGTDAGFALSRFLEYAGSMCDSPHSSIHSSPLLAPSVVTDLNTSTENPRSESPFTDPTITSHPISIPTKGDVPRFPLPGTSSLTEWSSWEWDESVNRYKRTREENGYLATEYYQDSGVAQIQQETTPHSEFQQSADSTSSPQIVTVDRNFSEELDEFRPVWAATGSAPIEATSKRQTYTGGNAWDDIPEIERYIGNLENNRKANSIILGGFGKVPVKDEADRRRSFPSQDQPGEIFWPPPTSHRNRKDSKLTVLCSYYEDDDRNYIGEAISSALNGWKDFDGKVSLAFTWKPGGQPVERKFNIVPDQSIKTGVVFGMKSLEYSAVARRTDQPRDPVQEEADRAYQEIVMARKIAGQAHFWGPEPSVVDKYHTDEEEEIIRIETPPNMKSNMNTGPYAAPNADVTVDRIVEKESDLQQQRRLWGLLKPERQLDPDAEFPRPFLNLIRPPCSPSPPWDAHISQLERLYSGGGVASKEIRD